VAPVSCKSLYTSWRRSNWTSGPAIDHKGVLASLLTSLGERDVLFIDEIHRLNAVVEENLYPAMEDYKFDLFIGDGPHAKAVTMKLPFRKSLWTSAGTYPSGR